MKILFSLILLFTSSGSLASANHLDITDQLFTALDCGTITQPADGVNIFDYSKNEVVNAHSIYAGGTMYAESCVNAFAHLSAEEAGVLTDGQLYKNSDNDLQYSANDFYFHGRSRFLSIRAVRSSTTSKVTGFMLMIPQAGQGEYDNDLVYVVRSEDKATKCNAGSLESIKFKSYTQKMKAQSALQMLCSFF